MNLLPAFEAARGFIRRLLRQKTAVLGLALIFAVFGMALLAPFLAPYDPYSTNIENRLQRPNNEHRWGTDVLGRDIMSRVIYGSRVSLQVGVIAVGISLVLGCTLGILAGFFGRWVDVLVMRLMDILLSLPSLLLALGLIAVLGPSLTNAMIAIGIASTPHFARIVRGQVLSVLALEYVEAGRAMGGRPLWIIRKHILPNVLAPVVVLASLRVATAILVEASLSFLGLGVQPPTASWGSMVAEGRRFLLTAPWVSLTPGVAIMLTVLGFNIAGDGLRDAMDPKLN
jgi:peptide/nickel transport system permease protein